MALSVKCESCGKKLTISDDVYERRIAGRVVHVRCKSCQANIRIDGRAAQAEVGADPEPEPEPEPAEEVKEPTSAERPWPTEAFPAPPPSEAAVELWAVDFGTSGHQELNSEEIYSGLRDGSISGATLVWTEGMDDWEPLAMVPTLAALIPATANSAPPSEKIRSHQPTLLGFNENDAVDSGSGHSLGHPKATLLGLASDRPAPPTADGTGPRPGGSAKQTLLGINTPEGHPSAQDRVNTWDNPVAPAPRAGGSFASLETLDESDPTTVYDPALGSGPYVAEAFGLPPQAAPQPAAHSSAPPAAARSSAPPAAPPVEANPFLAPPGTFPGTPRVPAAPQVPAFTAGQHSRPGGEFSQQANAFAPPTGGRSAGFVPRSSQAQLELLAEEAVPPKSRAPLVVALCAVVVAVGSLAFIALNARPAAPTVTFEQPAEPPAPRRSSNGAADSTASDAHPSQATGDFAKTFASAAGQASANSAPSTFDPERALAALREATPKAKACHRVGGPTRAEVVVKFQPSGRASGVRVTGDLAGTPTGMCLVSALSDVEIASFQGAAAEVRADVALE